MKKYIQAFLKQACCIFLSLIVILPFYMVFINSLKDKGESAKMTWHFRNSGCFPTIWKSLKKENWCRVLPTV